MRSYDIPEAPGAIGPYSHATRTGNLVFCSGQTPLDAKTMEIVGNTIEEQTEQVFDNLEAVLEGVGLGLREVLKTTVFLADMADFDGMNEVYARRFADHRPARSTIAVRENPRKALVEIECIAEIG